MLKTPGVMSQQLQRRRILAINKQELTNKQYMKGMYKKQGKKIRGKNQNLTV